VTQEVRAVDAPVEKGGRAQ